MSLPEATDTVHGILRNSVLPPPSTLRLNGIQTSQIGDLNEDSSPSCCATTSCDSFSFQQFRQHLQQQQQAKQCLPLRMRVQVPTASTAVAIQSPSLPNGTSSVPSFSEVSSVAVAAAAGTQQNSAHAATVKQSSAAAATPRLHSVVLPSSNASRELSVDRRLQQYPSVDSVYPGNARLSVFRGGELSLDETRHSNSVFEPTNWPPPSLIFYNNRTTTVDNLPKLLSCDHHQRELSFNTKQLEAQFDPTNVRQTAKRYVNAATAVSIPNYRPLTSQTKQNGHFAPTFISGLVNMDVNTASDITKEMSILSVSDSTSGQPATGQTSAISQLRSSDDIDTGSQDALPPTSESTSDDSSSVAPFTKVSQHS